jgi:hypothetical protein
MGKGAIDPDTGKPYLPVIESWQQDCRDEIARRDAEARRTGGRYTQTDVAVAAGMEPKAGQAAISDLLGRRAPATSTDVLPVSRVLGVELPAICRVIVAVYHLHDRGQPGPIEAAAQVLELVAGHWSTHDPAGGGSAPEQHQKNSEPEHSGQKN